MIKEKIQDGIKGLMSRPFDKAASNLAFIASHTAEIFLGSNTIIMMFDERPFLQKAMIVVTGGTLVCISRYVRDGIRMDAWKHNHRFLL